MRSTHTLMGKHQGEKFRGCFWFKPKMLGKVQIIFQLILGKEKRH